MNGLLVIDKDVGYTSRDVVNIVSDKLGTKKVGHTGTLDPLASGVLVLCVGKALKVAELITSYDKEYIARVRLGYETDTLDAEGRIVKVSEKKNFDERDIEIVLAKFIGKIKQEVPKYSAVKVNGKKLYEYARADMEVELPVREVEIFSLFLESAVELVNGYLEFSIKCSVSKGTYIRSLVRDIGRSLGSCATMIGLRRIRQGEFAIEEAYTLDDICNGNYRIKRISEVLDLPKIVVDEKLEFKIKNGQVMDKFFDCDKVIIMNKNNEILAIYMQSDNNKVRPFKVF